MFPLFFTGGHNAGSRKPSVCPEEVQPFKSSNCSGLPSSLDYRREPNLPAREPNLPANEIITSLDVTIFQVTRRRLDDKMVEKRVMVTYIVYNVRTMLAVIISSDDKKC
jgi:hypothetical protein